MLARLIKLALPTMVAALALTLASPVHAQDNKVLKVGTLKLIHGISAYFYEKFVPAGYTSRSSRSKVRPTARTRAHRHCRHLHPRHRRIPARRRRGEPVVIVANANNGRHGCHGRRQDDIKTIKDLKGKKVAIWPGSTQEAVILERLRMEGMTIKDIQPIRLAFSDHAGALAAATSTPMSAPSRRGHQPRQRHRPAGRVSLLHADRTAQHDLPRARRR